MTNNPPPPWVDVNEAAALVGKSVSTVRRLIPDIEEKAPDAIHREPIDGKGGEKVLLTSSSGSGAKCRRGCPVLFKQVRSRR